MFSCSDHSVTVPHINSDRLFSADCRKPPVGLWINLMFDLEAACQLAVTGQGTHRLGFKRPQLDK